MSFGSKLAAARRRNDLTQEQLGERLGVTRQAVSRWESDIAYPETEKIIRMARLLGLSCDELLLDGGTESDRETGSPVTRLLRDAVGKRIHLAFYESDSYVAHTYCTILDFDGGWANVEFVQGKRKPRTETRLIALADIRSITYDREEG